MRRVLLPALIVSIVACSSPGAASKPSPPPGAYSNGMVVTAQHLASEVA
jgi:hypothetical protein